MIIMYPYVPLYNNRKTLCTLFKNGDQLSQDYRTYTRRRFTFYREVPRSSWYSFDRPPKDERLSQPWSHSLSFTLSRLDWESSVLTTSHENENLISTLTTTRMNGSQVHFHPLVFIITLIISPDG